jgi:hypothetical protein
MLHLYQPTKGGTEELERMRPNGAVKYLGVDQFQSSLSLLLAYRHKKSLEDF